MTLPCFTNDQMRQLIEETIANIHKLRKLKGGEYAGDVDALANFRGGSRDLGLMMEHVWAIYAHKHWSAILQYVKDLGVGRERTRLESIEGRMDDLIVYLILAKAIYRERHGK